MVINLLILKHIYTNDIFIIIDLIQIYIYIDYILL